MHFQTKIIYMYSAFILIVAVILGSSYNFYSVYQHKRVEYENLKLVANQLEQNFNESYKQMHLVIDYILSDIQVVEAIGLLRAEDKVSKVAWDYREEALSTIRLKLNTDYIRKNFYRVVFFNQKGDVIASNNDGVRIIDRNQSIHSLAWISEVEDTKGDVVLIARHQDDWGLKKQPEVFSLAKKVQGERLGYIEVQKQAEDLKEIFQIVREDVGIVAIKDDGNILYSTKPEEYGTFYQEVARQLKPEQMIYRNTKSGEDEMIAFSYCKEAGVTLLVTEDFSQIESSATHITTTIVLLGLCLIVISLIYIVVASKYLTKPIRQLREQMEHTGLENLKAEIVVDQSNDEILALQKSYQQVLTRLDEAIIKEKKQSLLQIQAQFDLLQAQVNPHFLFNVLNVISNRGVLSGDEVICDMCRSLADMLRYSTSNKKREATIEAEANYLEKYFYLLKSRYDYKLSYEIHIEEQVKNQIVPKIVLQQIVENCINHGFKNMTRSMKVEVRGWQEKGYWYIRIVDNGEGFEESILEKLKEKMEDAKCFLKARTGNLQLEIGGMGLVNTYTRLYLLYGEELFFTLSNRERGAEVRIGAKIKGILGQE